MDWRYDHFGGGGQRGYSGLSMVRAWEDRERLMRGGEGEREDLIPKARGEARF